MFFYLQQGDVRVKRLGVAVWLSRLSDNMHLLLRVLHKWVRQASVRQKVRQNYDEAILWQNSLLLTFRLGLWRSDSAFASGSKGPRIEPTHLQAFCKDFKTSQRSNQEQQTSHVIPSRWLIFLRETQHFHKLIDW